MAGRPRRIEVPTTWGPAVAHVHPVAGRSAPVATLVLGHGAGRGSDTSDLLTLASWLPPVGICVVRVDQPWVVAGRRLAPAPRTLDTAWLEIVAKLPVSGALLLGGRSAGARVACRTQRALSAAGVLALAFPLHPPGRPERSRVDELRGASPVLVLQGERDAFGRPGELDTDLHRTDQMPGTGSPVCPAGLPGRALQVVPVAGADHALAIGLDDAVREQVIAWGIAVARASVGNSRRVRSTRRPPR